MRQCARYRITTPWALLVALGFSGGAVAQAADDWRDSAHVWRSTCGYCHGAGVARPLFGTPLPAIAIEAITRRGLNQMPAFTPSQISDRELTALADWIRAQPAPANTD